MSGKGAPWRHILQLSFSCVKVLHEARLIKITAVPRVPLEIQINPFIFYDYFLEFNGRFRAPGSLHPEGSTSRQCQQILAQRKFLLPQKKFPITSEIGDNMITRKLSLLKIYIMEVKLSCKIQHLVSQCSISIWDLKRAITPSNANTPQWTGGAWKRT